MTPINSRRWAALAGAAAVVLGPTGAAAPTLPPPPDHVVIVIEENRSYSDIIGNPDAPYINALARWGVLFNRAYAITHPSEPNYLALFSGATQGLRSDSCPHTFRGPNLATALRRAGLGFAIYSESLPAAGFSGCSAGEYRRKHNPVVNWQGVDVPAAVNRPFSAFPKDFRRLPTVSFVIPNMMNDMHDGSVKRADTWLREHLGAYIRWARTHNDLFILTWDEDDRQSGNHIPTIFVGGRVRPGVYTERIDHYRVLRTIEALYGLPPLGHSAQRRPITDIWRESGAAAH